MGGTLHISVFVEVGEMGVVKGGARGGADGGEADGVMEVGEMGLVEGAQDQDNSSEATGLKLRKVWVHTGQ